TVWSSAESEEGTLSQRRRWEGGFLQNAQSAGPAMLARSLARGDIRGLWAAIHIMIPPLALLLLLDLAAIAAATVLLILTGSSAWPLMPLGGALALAGIGIVM